MEILVENDYQGIEICLEPNPPFYNVELNATGVNQLMILTASITGLEAGDEIGVFDAMGVVESLSLIHI